jgi:hypothetical protein
LPQNADIKGIIRKSGKVSQSVLAKLKATRSPQGHTVILDLPSKYPMVYTLETIRRLLGNLGGVIAEWHGEDEWRPDIALEVAVEGVEGNDYTKKYLLDNFISSQLEVGGIISSRLDASTSTYRAIISNPMGVDQLLGTSIPALQGYRFKFELTSEVGKRHAPLKVPSPPSGPRLMVLELPGGPRYYSCCFKEAFALEKDLCHLVWCYMNLKQRSCFEPLPPIYYDDKSPVAVHTPWTAMNSDLMYNLHAAICAEDWLDFEDVLDKVNLLIRDLLPFQDTVTLWERTPRRLVRNIIEHICN